MVDSSLERSQLELKRLELERSQLELLRLELEMHRLELERWKQSRHTQPTARQVLATQAAALIMRSAGLGLSMWIVTKILHVSNLNLPAQHAAKIVCPDHTGSA